MKTEIHYNDGLELLFDPQENFFLFGSPVSGWYCSCPEARSHASCRHLLERGQAQQRGLQELREQTSKAYQGTREARITSSVHGDFLLIRLESKPPCLYRASDSAAWCGECESSGCYHARSVISIYAQHHRLAEPVLNVGAENTDALAMTFRAAIYAEEEVFGALYALNPRAPDDHKIVRF